MANLTAAAVQMWVVDAIENEMGQSVGAAGQSIKLNLSLLGSAIATDLELWALDADDESLGDQVKSYVASVLEPLPLAASDKHRVYSRIYGAFNNVVRADQEMALAVGETPQPAADGSLPPEAKSDSVSTAALVIGAAALLGLVLLWPKGKSKKAAPTA